MRSRAIHIHPLLSIVSIVLKKHSSLGSCADAWEITVCAPLNQNIKLLRNEFDRQIVNFIIKLQYRTKAKMHRANNCTD